MLSSPYVSLSLLYLQRYIQAFRKHSESMKKEGGAIFGVCNYGQKKANKIHKTLGILSPLYTL